MKVVRKNAFLPFLVILAGCGGGSSGNGGFAGSTGAGLAADTTTAAAPATSADSGGMVLTAMSTTDSGTKGTGNTVKKTEDGWTDVAAEGQSFTVSASTVVRYGAGTQWVTKTVSSSGVCSNGFFGSDPAPFVVKTCSAQSPAASTGSSSLRLADEGGTFSVTGSGTVQYGAGASWVNKTVTGSGSCTNGFFGQDPAPFVVKSCHLIGASSEQKPPVATAPASGTRLAGENETFSVASATTVRYGSGSSWVQKTITGSATCSNTYFGQDPAFNVAKACYSLGSASGTGTPMPPVVVAPPPPPAPTTPSGPAQANDVVDSSLNVVSTAYRSTASVMSKDSGLDYRFGPSAASYGVGDGGLPNLFKRADTKLGGAAPSEQFFWQVGGPPSGNAGAYSTNQANAVFVADNPSQRVGVTDFQVTGYMYNTYAQSPQLSWTITLVPGGGIDSQNVLSYKSTGTVGSDPVATARCAGAPGFCSQAVVAFQNGVIGTVGSNTAGNTTTVKLPANKVPTAIAMTNNSEFALVTVWDTTALKGQVAVIALAGLCDGCDPYNNGTNGARGYYEWWHEWMKAYPGLPNMGNIAFMKILGYVDLPGVTAPTDIAVTTGLHQFNTMQAGGRFMGMDNTPLTSHWQKFTNGGSNYGRYAKGGVAVVTSKSEQKVTFIDLKPLFSHIHGVYFSANSGAANNLGQGDSQWPYTFANTPSQTPTVIKTVSLPARPTAVKTTVAADDGRAWVATQDGTLRIFSLGGYAPGPAVQSPTASAIAEVGTVAGIGRNPTSLATSKGEPNANIDSSNLQVIVTSRGDRKLSWVRFANNGNSGSVIRTLQDQRLKDPVAAEDSDNFANSGYVVSVADYADKSIKNFRYGPVIFSDGGSCPAPNGCPVNPTGGVAIEYAGSLSLPGKPFQVTTANVP